MLAELAKKWVRSCPGDVGEYEWLWSGEGVQRRENWGRDATLGAFSPFAAAHCHADSPTQAVPEALDSSVLSTAS
jgi:hypothetical protein